MGGFSDIGARHFFDRPMPELVLKEPLFSILRYPLTLSKQVLNVSDINQHYKFDDGVLKFLLKLLGNY